MKELRVDLYSIDRVTAPKDSVFMSLVLRSMDAFTHQYTGNPIRVCNLPYIMGACNSTDCGIVDWGLSISPKESAYAI